MDISMFVLKRNGEPEVLSYNKIVQRIKQVGSDDLSIAYSDLVMKIMDQLYNNIPTSKIDEPYL